MSAVHKKLMQARIELHGLRIAKSGRNEFAKYNYMELGDFLIPTQEIFARLGLCGLVSFTADIATLTIVDVEDGSQVVVTSPMGSAALKGCHEVQNIGAVETYQRRYLWVTAMEIVEHDAIDASTGNDEPKKKIVHTPTGTPLVAQKRLSVIADVADAIKSRFSANDIIGMIEKYEGITDGEEITALWKLLPSAIRAAITKQLATT